ncbi:MAG: hypothetical protein HY235_26005 [Acidobacteria bacterium]|nr:hypothetical protein [Acidobacteriota bacterium]
MMFTPRLHKLLVSALLRTVWEAIKGIPGLVEASGSAIPAAITDESAGRLGGTLLAKLGSADFTSKLGVVKAIFSVLLSIALSAAKAAAKAVGSKVGQADPAVLMQRVQIAKRAGVAISQHEAREIAAEIRQQGEKVKQVLQEAIQSIDAVAVASS